MKIQMKLFSIPTAVALAAGFALAGCDNSQSYSEPAVMEVEEVEEAAPAADESAAPAVAETPAPVTEAVPTEALPPETKTSEESVQPESETLFY